MAEVEYERFLRYVSAITDYLPLGEKGSDKWIRPPFAFTMMVALNELLLEPDTEIEKDHIIRCTPIIRSRFKKTITSRSRWLGNDAQFQDTLRKFTAKGLLSGDGILSMTDQLLSLLVGYAKAAYGSATGKESPEDWAPATKDWLALNRNVFHSIFYSEFGITWRDLRESINGSIATSRNVKNHYNMDHIGADTTYWVVINIVLLVDRVSDWDINHHIQCLGLKGLAGSVGEVTSAIKNLGVANVIVSESSYLRLASTLDQKASSYRSAVERTMQVLRAGCEQWTASEI